MTTSSRNPPSWLEIIMAIVEIVCGIAAVLPGAVLLMVGAAAHEVVLASAGAGMAFAGILLVVSGVKHIEPTTITGGVSPGFEVIVGGASTSVGGLLLVLSIGVITSQSELRIFPLPKYFIGIGALYASIGVIEIIRGVTRPAPERRTDKA